MLCRHLGVYRTNGVFLQFPSAGLGSREAVAEGDREGVERGLPLHHPSSLATSCGVQRPGDKVGTFGLGGVMGKWPRALIAWRCRGLSDSIRGQHPANFGRVALPHASVARTDC